MAKQFASITFTFFIFFLLLFAYTKLVGPIPFQINSIATTKSTTFDVMGTGKATIKPDLANVSAGVTSNGSSVKEVQEQMNSIINKVSVAIKELGVDAKDIKTNNYNVNPSYDYSGGTQRITGYSANTSLIVKVKDIGKVNQVIDAATSAGANNVSSLGFDTADKTAAENEARKIAIEEAKQKAENAASIAGFKLGSLVNYSENFGDFVGPRPLMESTVGKVDTSTQLEPGSTEVNVTVTLSYEIR